MYDVRNKRLGYLHFVSLCMCFIPEKMYHYSFYQTCMLNYSIQNSFP